MKEEKPVVLYIVEGYFSQSQNILLLGRYIYHHLCILSDQKEALWDQIDTHHPGSCQAHKSPGL